MYSKLHKIWFYSRVTRQSNPMFCFKSESLLEWLMSIWLILNQPITQGQFHGLIPVGSCPDCVWVRVRVFPGSWYRAMFWIQYGNNDYGTLVSWLLLSSDCHFSRTFQYSATERGHRNLGRGTGRTADLSGPKSYCTLQNVMLTL